MRFKQIFIGGVAMACFGLVACTPENSKSVDTADKTTSNTEATQTLKDHIGAQQTLDEILNAQSPEAKARYPYRHPKETLEYFGVKPGMTVATVLPGQGWYSKILLPYLGEDGHLIGIDYSLSMWPKFGGFATEEFLEKRKSWTQSWTQEAQEWRGENGASIGAFVFETRPRNLDGTVDMVLLVRAMHHLNRFDAAHWDPALADVRAILKPNGLVGIVQHRAAEDMSDVWASGDNGYLKQSFVIRKMEEAGFELVKDPSDINSNPKDQPTSADIVWRLPPSLATSQNDPELKAKFQAIGESDRMTLLFRKR